MPSAILSELVALSRRLGAPERRCSIIGEGNTSARIDENSFFVKTSGVSLTEARPDDFVRIEHARALALVETDDLGFRAASLGLADAKFDHEAHAHPSRESLLHAVCLEFESVRFVARTHPTAINALTCSRGFPELAENRLMPDEVAVCGPAPLALRYTTPGVDLARELRGAAKRYADQYGTHPRVVLLQNNGMIALGESAQGALAITALATEWATVLAATQAFGGPQPLDANAVARLIDTRDGFEGPSIERL